MDNKKYKPLSNDEVEMSNELIDLQIELNQNKELLENLMKNNRTTITDLRITKKLIESLLKEKDDNNCLLIIGNYKVDRLNKIIEINHKLMN